MLRRARTWLERQKSMGDSRTVPRIDRCTVTEVEGKKGYYTVVIEGIHLTPALSPPSVTVGGQRLERPLFEPGGRRITGTLRAKPKDKRVLLDLGYTLLQWDGASQ